ncbi:31348_t:CDS:2, partial [Gigaspora margarita]
SVDVPTICAILKEKFEKRELDTEEFVKILDQFKYDDAKFFYYIDINEDTKKLEQAIWMFPKQRINYSRFNNIVVYNNTYKTNCFKMPFAVTYLSFMEKTKEKWATCFNSDIFMANMTTIQCGESMNNMIKGYLDANTSLTMFITAFQSALDTQNKKTEF